MSNANVVDVPEEESLTLNEENGSADAFGIDASAPGDDDDPLSIGDRQHAPSDGTAGSPVPMLKDNQGDPGLNPQDDDEKSDRANYDEQAPKSFPQKLMEILSDDANNEIVSWCLQGNGFQIHRKKQFAADIMPKYFKASKFTSFTRKLNRWGFNRIARGPETGAYYHKLFSRDKPELCLQMTSNSGIKYSSPQGLHHPLLPGLPGTAAIAPILTPGVPNAGMFPYMAAPPPMMMMPNLATQQQPQQQQQQQQQQMMWQQQMQMMQFQQMQMMQMQQQQQQQTPQAYPPHQQFIYNGVMAGVGMAPIPAGTSAMTPSTLPGANPTAVTSPTGSTNPAVTTPSKQQPGLPLASPVVVMNNPGVTQEAPLDSPNVDIQAQAIV